MLDLLLSTIEDAQDRSLFEDIYHQYLPKMKRIAHHYLSIQEDAEDALQEAFKAIVQNIEKLRSRKDIEINIYITKTVKSACIDILRKQRQYESIDTCYHLCSDENVVEEAIDRDLYARVMEYVTTQMPPQYIDALTLRLIHGMSAGEIAIALHRSPNTVRSWLRRGQQMLRKRFPEEYTHEKKEK